MYSLIMVLFCRQKDAQISLLTACMAPITPCCETRLGFKYADGL